MIPWIDELSPKFPPVETATEEPDGLLCAGGNLDITTLLNAYSQGIFPWFNDGQPVLWWSPNPRMVVSPDTFHPSRRLRRFIRKMDWQVTADRAFTDVIQHCSAILRSGQDGTWITPDIIEAYTQMHKAGYAHSIEVWNDDGELCGGLYGVALGRIFFGESMFSNESNASKVALTFLVNSGCYDLMDCQVYTNHLESMGGQLTPRNEFVQAIKSLSQLPADVLADAITAVGFEKGFEQGGIEP